MPIRLRNGAKKQYESRPAKSHYRKPVFIPRIPTRLEQPHLPAAVQRWKPTAVQRWKPTTVQRWKPTTVQR